jgi:hypothetical protein
MSRVTPAIMQKGLMFGLKPERIEWLMSIADLPNYDAIDPDRKDSYTLIKPDPDGVFYLKVSISGKWVVKPLDMDEKTSRARVKAKLKELGYAGK